MGRTVILVDEANTPLGEADIIEAHTGAGKLHRAFSVYVFRNNRSEFLMQQRSSKKMLWPGAWANTCCSHPFAFESPSQAGQRRLLEELGFTCPLTERGSFVYKAEDPNGRGIEYEHVTLLEGNGDHADILPDPDEVTEYQWIPVDELRQAMKTRPDLYAPWFHEGLELILSLPAL